MATRLFRSPLGAAYAVPEEPVADKVTLVRLASASPDYRTKEAMHAEVASFAENLIAWIAAQDRAPDLIHAHYADAATVAALVEDRLGIPFVFTGHSLGRVKARMLGASPVRPDLAHRIAAEEEALARAQLVIASSRDEAEVQYASYTAYDPGRVRVLPPGSDLARFAAAQTHPGSTRRSTVSSTIRPSRRSWRSPVRWRARTSRRWCAPMARTGRSRPAPIS